MAAPSDRTADPGAGDYPAPLATGPVDAVVTLPGSKSVTNRALILAALADGPSTLVAPLAARDTELMAAGLRALGVTVDDRAGDHWRVEPRPLRGPAAVDVGNAGTVMRFLPPVAALADGDVAFDGDPRSHERPLGPVVDALRALGAVVDDAGRRALPFVVRGRGGVRGGEVTIDASASSQFVSALLLAAPRFDEGVTVRHVGPPVPSQPHIDMTVEMLRAAGADLDISQDDVWRVSPGVLRGRHVHVEPDLSNAAPFLAAAVVTGGTVRVPGWPAHTTQPGDRLRALFGAMGATVTLDADGLTLTGPTTVGPLDADLHDVGELAPVLAAVAAVASGPSTLRGIAHLRAHETDRLAALARELGALGAHVVELDDGLRIEPGPLHGGRFATYDDHRLATAAAVLGLVVPGVVVENIATVAKTMPDFVQRWRTMLDGGPPAGAPAATGRGPAITGAARRSSVAAPLRVIAIDGPAGSGKSTVGRALARELGLEYLDTGAMYRAVAFAALSRGVDPDDRDRVAGIAHDAVIEVGPRGVFVDGIDATVEIRGPEVTRAVSAVAANPAVREELKARQREWAIARGGGVLEGRDIGTVVFPEAVLKVYLTAGAETRAERRSKEVRELDYETVAADLARRDALDQNRTHDPLTVATDAYVLDTSSLSIDEVVADIVAHLPEDARE